ncbi:MULTISPECIES: tRNA pseudouridine(13) synthase TruD [Methylomonas]|uniref:tRNA pseudouridine synthase D n=2 Tax=Methylomonas TaxID=416 RepID=A0A126T7B9_9GAMM|nr:MULTISPECIES: tRNA pseudouridine(13) synthase TruD [Methylomonas]AMK77948.1 pseudouridine synthase [Methylomonas denitrificans]OAI07747.1 tRNA pseudouridine synthase TruD [Methylomonas methanica]TCV85481.1 tRNA pseudouridine13 synthase [Methylomonas methanica]
MTEFSLPEWPYACGGPSGTGDIKTEPEDFVVEEILSFEPEGSGEHIFLYIEKIGENTEYVARQLARHAGVRQRDVSYAGLKDRHGRTRQWFSVWLPGKEDPNWNGFETDQLKILQTVRHARKLKRGVLAGNRFTLLIRNWTGDRELAERQLQQIRNQGFPNYFGPQRFGHHGQNINRALAMFTGAKVKREQRSLYLSAARSYLFNLILARRVEQTNWQRAINGDVFKLDGSNSCFAGDSNDVSLSARVEQGDIHPTGIMWGRGGKVATAEAGAIENAVIAANASIADGLIAFDLEADRRALRVLPQDLDWQWLDNQLKLSFSLPAGSYATALLREIIGDAPGAGF